MCGLGSTAYLVMVVLQTGGAPVSPASPASPSTMTPLLLLLLALLDAAPPPAPPALLDVVAAPPAPPSPPLDALVLLVLVLLELDADDELDDEAPPAPPAPPLPLLLDEVVPAVSGDSPQAMASHGDASANRTGRKRKDRMAPRDATAPAPPRHARRRGRIRPGAGG
jgi:hypothetical protein